MAQVPPLAGIVYTRTYEVDFRFIALPSDFSEEDRHWIASHVYGLTRFAEGLPNNPRWFLGKRNQRCAFGITGMVADFLKVQDQPNSVWTHNITADFKERPIYAFLGYAFQLDGSNLALPDYGQRNLEMFFPLLEMIHQRWTVKPYEDEARSVSLTQYQPTAIPVIYEASQRVAEITEHLNEDQQKVFLYPDSELNRQQLWHNAIALCSSSWEQEISLGLGLKNSQDGLASPYGNVTVKGLLQVTILERPKPVLEEGPETSPLSGSPTKVSNIEVSSRHIKGGLLSLLLTIPVGVLILLIAGTKLTGVLIALTIILVGWVLGMLLQPKLDKSRLWPTPTQFKHHRSTAPAQSENALPGVSLKPRKELPPKSTNSKETDWF